MDVNETSDFPEACRSATEIDGLFDELMIKIFTYLTVKEKMGVERVCWRWKHLVQRSWSVQKTLHFQNMFKRFGGMVTFEALPGFWGQGIKGIYFNGTKAIFG